MTNVERDLQTAVSLLESGQLNDMQGSAYWNITKRYIRVYFKQNNISEISFRGFEQLTNLNKDYARKMLLEINKEFIAEKMK